MPGRSIETLVDNRNTCRNKFDLRVRDGSIFVGEVPHPFARQILGFDKLEPGMCFFGDERERTTDVADDGPPVFRQSPLFFGRQLAFQVLAVDHWHPRLAPLARGHGTAPVRLARYGFRERLQRKTKRAAERVDRNDRRHNADDFHVFGVGRAGR